MADAANALALVGGTIHVSPLDEPIRDGAIVVRDGRIAEVGSRTAIALAEGTRVVDCGGATIAAGFWNSHVHFFER